MVLHFNRKAALLIASVFAALLVAAPVSAAIIEELVEIPVEASDRRGQTVAQSIKVTIIRDDARARSGFMVFNHGRAPTREGNATRTHSSAYKDNARWFASKGFAVFLPMRIGYGETGGPDVEESGPCNAKNYPPVYDAAAAQTLKVIAYAKGLSYIDAANGVVAGQSFGGTTAITLAARNIAGVRAAVNFAGGGGGNPQTLPENPCGERLLADLFASYGASARIPTLWLYSENDLYWGKDKPHAWFDGFMARGGVGKFVQLPPYQADGHPIYTGNPSSWRPELETFLQACCSQIAAVQATPPPLKGGEGLEGFTQALSNWADKYKVAKAVIVVRHKDRIIHRVGIGGADPDASYHLASLSKAITGTCIATLVRDRKLTFETLLSKALAKFFAANGRPVDQRMERVTLGQLLTHRAGFAGADDGDDAATGTILKDYLSAHSPRDVAGPEYLAAIFKTPLTRAPGARFDYSNAGYLILGAIIEEATGKSYENFCRDAVLTPNGAKGGLDPGWRVMGSYGGWRMTGADYLAFHEVFNWKLGKLGPAAQKWMLEKSGKTYGNTKFPVWYGLGARLRDPGKGIEIWHTGSWVRNMPRDDKGPLSINTSTLVMRNADGASWFVYSTPLVLGDARNELNQVLLKAWQDARPRE